MKGVAVRRISETEGLTTSIETVGIQNGVGTVEQPFWLTLLQAA